MKTNILKSAIKNSLALALAGSAFVAAPVMAQNNATYAPGDLLLYFQQYLGTQTVLVNLGTAFSYRDKTANQMNIVNIGGALTGSVGSGGAGFSSTWYENSDMFWGLAAVRSAVTTTTSQLDGDPNRTIYISAPRATAGSDGVADSVAWTGIGNTPMTTASNQISNQNNRMENFSTTTLLVEGTGTSTIDDQNPFTILGAPRTAFQVFPGGVMGSFSTGSFGTMGGVAAEGALDLYRILATTGPSGTVIEAGDGVGNGSYQGTFIISNTGSVSYLAPVPEPSTFVLLAGSTIFGLVRRRRSQRA